jgi:ribonuclease Z
MLNLTILGNNAALPAHGRLTTSQIFSTDKYRFLIDCGEGTQILFQKYHISPNKISHILISHLHGDHYLGLIGLLSSMHLQNRIEPIYIFAPRELGEIIRLQLKASHTILKYELLFSALSAESSEVFYENEQLSVATIPMNHRIKPCNGFLFKEKPKKRNVLADKLPADLPFQVFIQLKNSENILDESGNILYAFEDYTVQNPSYSFAHCSDTLYHESIIESISGVDLLYHEATFAHTELEKAKATHHSTATQAATLALKANVGKLVIGHFSSRYENPEELLEEARIIFPNTHLAIEGERFAIPSSIS